MGDQDLIDKLVPDYAPFSRRPVVDNGWYKALTRDNVELVTDGDRPVHAEGHRDRRRHGATRSTPSSPPPASTSSSTSGRPTTPASDGVDIHDFWSKDGPRAYLSMMVPELPEHVHALRARTRSRSRAAPASRLVRASGRPTSRSCIVRMIEEGKIQRRGQARGVTSATTRRSTRRRSKLLLLQDEGAPDKNYYVNEYGRMQVNAPWYGPEYHRLCTEVNWDDIIIS